MPKNLFQQANIDFRVPQNGFKIIPKCSQNYLKMLPKSIQNRSPSLPGTFENSREKYRKSVPNVTSGIIDFGAVFGPKTIKSQSKNQGK